MRQKIKLRSTLHARTTKSHFNMKKSHVRYRNVEVGEKRNTYVTVLCNIKPNHHCLCRNILWEQHAANSSGAVQQSIGHLHNGLLSDWPRLWYTLVSHCAHR